MFTVGVYRGEETLSKVQHNMGQYPKTGAIPKPQSTVRQQNVDVGKRLRRQKSCCRASTTDNFCNAVCSQYSTVGMYNFIRPNLQSSSRFIIAIGSVLLFSMNTVEDKAAYRVINCAAPQYDFNSLRERLSVLVSRILVHHVAFFRGQHVQQHISHRYSAESAIKSDLVGLYTRTFLSICVAGNSSVIVNADTDTLLKFKCRIPMGWCGLRIC